MKIVALLTEEGQLMPVADVLKALSKEKPAAAAAVKGRRPPVKSATSIRDAIIQMVDRSKDGMTTREIRAYLVNKTKFLEGKTKGHLNNVLFGMKRNEALIVENSKYYVGE